MYYYTNRERTKLIIIGDNETPASGSSVDVYYSKVPAKLENDTDEPEFQERFHLALVHGTIAKITGDAHHVNEYRELIRKARETSRPTHPTVRQYDY